MKKHARSIHTEKFYPVVKGLPDLPPIRWEAVGQSAPTLLPLPPPSGSLPRADVVVVTWAGAEWAAMQHVFIQSEASMPYSDAQNTWPHWQKYDSDLPKHNGEEDWSYWGYYRLVEIAGRTVLLFKSNTHLDWPGAAILTTLFERIATEVQPEQIFSIGTAGGCRPSDHLGAVSVVNAGTMYAAQQPANEWPTYRCDYRPDWSLLSHPMFSALMFTVPATPEQLADISHQFNTHYSSSYSLSDLDAHSLCLPTSPAAVSDLTADGTSLLTTSTFVVGTTDGNYAQYSVIEMDDAVIAKVCSERGISFGFVRNVSDPAQNPALPQEVQISWGSAIYDVYGFYTSYNGALVVWGLIAGQDATTCG